MDIVHLIVGNEDIYASRDLLLKSDYFRGVFEFEKDNIVIHNMDSFKFRILLLMMEAQYDVTKEIATMHDAFGFEPCETLKKYKCDVKNCNGVKLTEYCRDHECLVEGCSLMRRGNSEYCSMHKCSNCDVMVCDKTYYCKKHKCSFGFCNNMKYGISGYCCVHTYNYGYDNSCNNMAVTWAHFCVDHKCVCSWCINAISSKESKFCLEHEKKKIN